MILAEDVKKLLYDKESKLERKDRIAMEGKIPIVDQEEKQPNKILLMPNKNLQQNKINRLTQWIK